jgi:hypothetical protein
VCLLWVLLYAVNVHAEYECDWVTQHHDIASVNGFVQRVATWFTGWTGWRSSPPGAMCMETHILSVCLRTRQVA